MFLACPACLRFALGWAPSASASRTSAAAINQVVDRRFDEQMAAPWTRFPRVRDRVQALVYAAVVGCSPC